VQILKDLEEVLNPKADRDAGRTGLAERKEWLLNAVAEYVNKPNRQDWKTPDDTVRESER
jgi:hypothetical protein